MKRMIRRFWIYNRFGIKLRVWWSRVTCKHERVLTFYPVLDRSYWSLDGVGKGHHEGIEVNGCHSCGKMWIKDYRQ